MEYTLERTWDQWKYYEMQMKMGYPNVNRHNCENITSCRTTYAVGKTRPLMLFQVNIAVFYVNLGGVFNCLAYTFVRCHNASGGRQDTGTGRQDKNNRREARRENNLESISTSVSSLSKYE